MERLSVHTGVPRAEEGVLADEERVPTMELVCGACGYGIRVRRLPERCPMCQGHRWREPRRPRRRGAASPGGEG